MSDGKFTELWVDTFLDQASFLLQEYGTVKRLDPETVIVFETHNGEIFSVHFAFEEEVLVVEINWSIFLSDIIDTDLGGLSNRLHLTAKCMEVFHSLGFDDASDGCDASSIIIKKEYPYPLLGADSEALLLLLGDYFKKAEKLLKKEQSKKK